MQARNGIEGVKDEPSPSYKEAFNDLEPQFHLGLGLAKLISSSFVCSHLANISYQYRGVGKTSVTQSHCCVHQYLQ